MIMADKLDENIVMTRQQVRDFDKWAIESLKIPGVVLMENAGKNFADIIMPDIRQAGVKKICIFCGTGNNGGDGYVIARHLENNNFRTKVVIVGDIEKITGDAKTNLEIIRNMGLKIENITAAEMVSQSRIADLMKDCDLIIDAIFGTGLTGQLRPEYQSLINAINSTGRDIFAVDIPSGLDCDTGNPLGCAIKAKRTITFVAMKQGFLNAAAKQYTGKIDVVSIGIGVK
jgi:NAD(P)H-hydrate epimerase